MKSLLQLVKRAFRHEPPLHPTDRKIAKRWIKQRLIAVFPELRKNPAALERAYQSLNLEVRSGEDESAVFEVQLPEGKEPEQ
ncbi:MAG TPA: hypothetical protein VGH90_13225 [Chthoniobacteraceae bacterium]|jgi:hypothetical protein